MTTETGKRVGERYEIVGQLGGGSQGMTYLAVDSESGDEVVVKEFTIASMAGWKSLELFEREVATLRTLDHPGIPKFLDAVETNDAHYLVQEYIDGPGVAQLVGDGAFDASELRVIARDVLNVLAYLHGLVPPVVHRDIKPSNIIQRGSGAYVVVDFGGVQNIVATDTGGSTVVGTTGYMPSEQLIGRAVPQSDLYALGATLAHLATGVHPAEMPTARLKLDWRSAGDVELSPELSAVIDNLVEPAPEDRPASARDVLAQLGEARPEMRTSSATRRGSEAANAKRDLVVRPKLTAMVQRPASEPGSDISELFSVAGDRLIVDLGGKYSAFDHLVVEGGIVLGMMLTIAMDSVIPLVGGIVLATYYLTQYFFRDARLQIDRNGQFSVLRHDHPPIRGQLHDLRLDDSLMLVDDSGPTVTLTEQLDTAERPWVAWAIQHYLEHGELPAALKD